MYSFNYRGPFAGGPPAMQTNYPKSYLFPMIPGLPGSQSQMLTWWQKPAWRKVGSKSAKERGAVTAATIFTLCCLIPLHRQGGEKQLLMDNSVQGTFPPISMSSYRNVLLWWLPLNHAGRPSQQLEFMRASTPRQFTKRVECGKKLEPHREQ